MPDKCNQGYVEITYKLHAIENSNFMHTAIMHDVSRTFAMFPHSMPI